MISKVRSEYKAEHNDRAGKISRVAAAALKELSLFRSNGCFTPQALDAEVARIAQEKWWPHGYDLVVHRMDNGLTRFLIKVQSTGRSYDLIKSFFHRDDESASQIRV